jgi:hypothetical protein
MSTCIAVEGLASEWFHLMLMTTLLGHVAYHDIIRPSLRLLRSWLWRRFDEGAAE